MHKLKKILVGCQEQIHKGASGSVKGQTMTEYALILAAVAIVAYVTYQVMGQDIGSMVSKINTARLAS
jgi:Flp pilus assembly pilin Flp